ncbi:unnamed protein product [Rotaria magnacalcarata]|uniref:F-box domain-containing protein n=1 Tax=Rotaria magnacalcarata TaxID=392030 RepID=A0A8S2J715_9BILA|nr:unnamed protein product [Rotaria magnacalcarata]
MPEKISLKLDTLPVELIYRILDHLDALVILCSLQNINTRMNAIITSYQPFQAFATLDVGQRRLSYERFDWANIIRYNTTLTTMIFCKNNLDDRAIANLVRGLEHNSTLISFDLSYNRIKTAGARDIATVLKYNQTLETLNLSQNKIGIAGAISLAIVLKHNTTLTKLDIKSNSCGDEGEQLVTDALQRTTVNQFIFHKFQSHYYQNLAARVT